MGGGFNIEHRVQIYAQKKDSYGSSSYGGRRYGGLSNFLGTVGEQLNTYMVNEAQADNQAYFAWIASNDSNALKMGDRREEMTAQVLKNITDQTGLTFTHEKRFVDVWFITEDK